MRKYKVIILLSSMLIFIVGARIIFAALPMARQSDDIFLWSRQQVQGLLLTLQPQRQQTLNAQVAFIVQQLIDMPYAEHNTGEGDWQPAATTYQPGAVQIKAAPVYRLDSFDCQTLVEVVMALLHANNLAQFERAFLQIAYGAAGNPDGEIVRYDNRNHFVDGDFNPINQRHGRLKEVTAQGLLAPYAKTTSAAITRQTWFSYQGVTDKKINSAKFVKEKVTITYLPKTILAIPQANNRYQPNQALLAQIPTPAVVETVFDPRIWANGKNIKYWIGSETSIAHMGLLYKKTFRDGELIYHKITCAPDTQRTQTACTVTPIICKQKQCEELMLAHATKAYPKNYYWYPQANGNYVCAAQPAKNKAGQNTPRCNRIEAVPLFAYLTEYQYDRYTRMHNPAMLGVHIEQLL